MAGGAAITIYGVQDENGGKVGDRMAVGAGLIVGLAAIGRRIDLNGVVDGAARGAMVVGVKIAGVTAAALAATRDGRGDQGAAAGCVVAGGAALSGMDFA